MTAHHLDRIGARPELKAFITTVDAERALERARTIDRGPAPTGLLAGVPFAPKDCWDTAGLRTTFGSSIFRERVPERTAPPCQRIVDAGAVILGKANLNEFARGVTSSQRDLRPVPEPGPPRLHARGIVGRQRGGARGRPRRARSRHRRRRLHPLAVRRVRRLRLQAALRARLRWRGRSAWRSRSTTRVQWRHRSTTWILAMEVLVGQPPPTPRLPRAARRPATPAATSALERGLLCRGRRRRPGVGDPRLRAPHRLSTWPSSRTRIATSIRPMRPSTHRRRGAMLERGRAVTAVEYRAAAVALGRVAPDLRGDAGLAIFVVGPTLDGDPPRLGEARGPTPCCCASRGSPGPSTSWAGPPRPRGTARSSPVATRRSCSARRLPGTGAWPTDRSSVYWSYRSTD